MGRLREEVENPDAVVFREPSVGDASKQGDSDLFPESRVQILESPKESGNRVRHWGETLQVFDYNRN